MIINNNDNNDNTFYILKEYFAIELDKFNITNKQYKELLSELHCFYQFDNIKGLLILENYSKQIFSGKLSEYYDDDNTYIGVDKNILNNSYRFIKKIEIKELNLFSSKWLTEYYESLKINDEFQYIINNFKITNYGLYFIGKAN